MTEILITEAQKADTLPLTHTKRCLFCIGLHIPSTCVVVPGGCADD